MNIFFLSNDPIVAAKAMTDKHVVKMVVESAQLLSTAHRVLDGEEFIQLSKSGARLKKWSHPNTILNETLYKSTHVNHPSAIWVRESSENYQWLYQHFVALCNEYTFRYDKIHATEKLLINILAASPSNIPKINMTPIKIAIKDEKWHDIDPVQSYINYYIGEKLLTDKDIKRFTKVLKI